MIKVSVFLPPNSSIPNIITYLPILSLILISYVFMSETLNQILWVIYPDLKIICNVEEINNWKATY